MFKVGDEVIVTGDSYGITTEGSVGVVIEINTRTDQVLVFFTTLTSGMYGQHDYGQPSDHYYINIDDLGLTSPVNPQLAVIAKIKEMEARRIKMRQAHQGKLLKKAKVKSNDVPVAPYF
jgi:hypothetical protein